MISWWNPKSTAQGVDPLLALRLSERLATQCIDQGPSGWLASPEGKGVAALLARLLYGTGIRLRVKDVDFDRHVIIVREASSAFAPGLTYLNLKSSRS